jgi:Uma2 family endonuclease
MSPDLPRAVQQYLYEREAWDYCRSLPLEHYMEGIAQASQREITLESLALVRARRPEVRVFNELLVQYPRRGKKPGQVVPDNMVVLTSKPIHAVNSYNVTEEPAPPFWTLEYVSKSNPRKDYEESFHKYEQDLKVPYYLTFHPDVQEMTLFRHNRQKYVTVKPNGNGRCAIRKLSLEVGLLGGWLRFWYEGELLPLPADLLNSLDEARRRAEEEYRRAEEEKQRAEEEHRRAEQERQRAEQEKQRADEARRRADELQRQLEAAERELAELKARLGER